MNGPGDRALPAPGYDVAAAAADLALLVALYIAGNWIHHPRTMPMPLTHFASWPSERLTGAVAFVLAVAAGLARELLRGDAPVASRSPWWR